VITEKSSQLALRVFSKVLSCQEISKALDWQPSEEFEKGELFGGRTNKRPREESLWRYDFPSDEKVLFTEQLQILVNEILTKKECFYKIQGKCEVDIFCGYTTYNGQGGFTLESKLMGELSALGIDLSIDFYSLDKTFNQSVVKSD
jgi:hypothetical protein